MSELFGPSWFESYCNQIALQLGMGILTIQSQQEAAEAQERLAGARFKCQLEEYEMHKAIYQKRLEA